MTVEEFCIKHLACNVGSKWAITNCQTLQEAWDTAPSEWLIWGATRKGVLTDKELRLFAVFCARQNQHLLTDERSLQAIDVAERYADGNATADELKSAWSAATAATEGLARDADRAAFEARNATSAAASAAARAAVWAADAAADAAANAAEAAAANAAEAAARDAQAGWLRKNTKPNFQA